MSDAPANVDPAPSRHTLPSILLGVFILWELFYLPAANFIKLLPVRLPPHQGELNDEVQIRANEMAGGVGQVVRDGLAYAMSRWGEATGQTQGWALFAPTFGHQASLPALKLEGTTVHSSFKPDNPNVYFRMPWPSCRLFNYEYRIALLYWRWTPESFREELEEWQRTLEQRVRWQQRSMLAYMRWRVDKYVRENSLPGRPTVVELYAELFPSPPPESPFAMRSDPVTYGLAKWLPGTTPPPGCLPLQARNWPAGWVWLPEED